MKSNLWYQINKIVYLQKKLRANKHFWMRRRGRGRRRRRENKNLFMKSNLWSQINKICLWESHFWCSWTQKFSKECKRLWNQIYGTKSTKFVYESHICDVHEHKNFQKSVNIYEIKFMVPNKQNLFMRATFLVFMNKKIFKRV